MAKVSSDRADCYYVIFDGEGWKIQCDGENTEPYQNKVEAFRDAVALARLNNHNGRKAAVIVQGDDDVFRTLWDSSKDEYSPRLVPE